MVQRPGQQSNKLMTAEEEFLAERRKKMKKEENYES